ncbi:hypothetical protein THAOC_03106 [Thalassiosira oceanica]|uniref:Uncharacterized protein n=1 Tax=Thalassiosira oceanica TaxID=159749 RepID=K0TQ00_THAOC|nr:hypothetical protein THAOC_03106 [Thalassiosira oceanica]|eukprot:EJK75182.1 hypothetical protein THAOC_03106 [Thalassiosira oceanica]
MLSKESIHAEAGHCVGIPSFRTLWPLSSEPLGAVASGRDRGSKSVGRRSGELHREIDSRSLHLTMTMKESAYAGAGHSAGMPGLCRLWPIPPIPP